MSKSPLRIALFTITFACATGANSQWVQNNFEGQKVEYICVGPDSVLCLGIEIPGLNITYDIHRTTNGGNSWFPINDGLPDTSYFVSNLFTDSTTYIYLGVSDSGLYRLGRNDTTWVKVLSTPFDSPLSGFAGSSGTIFVGTGSTGLIYRSRDSGEAWEMVYPQGDQSGFTAITGLVRSIDGRIIASAVEFRGGAWFMGSDDEGTTWTHLGGNGEFYYQMASSPNGSVFGVTDNGRLYRSVDNGATWVLRDSFLVAFAPSYIVDSSGTIYACRAGGVFYSTDEGETWVNISGNLPSDPAARSLVLTNDAHLFMGSALYGLWKTEDPITSINRIDNTNGLPNTPLLVQNYPNPFNPATTIRFQIADYGLVTLTVYDLLGREVATIVNERLGPGTYTRQWDATGLASGVYLYRLSAGDFVQTRELVLIQ